MSSVESAIGSDSAAYEAGALHRKIDWTGAFWVASGVPALVLFSIGAIAATVGRPSWVVWTVSIIFGFLQSFTYAEIAGLFPNKSGGASVYGAVAWVRYSKIIAPVSVWCNWFAWSPVLAIGSGLGAGYILSILFAPTAEINTWHITLLHLGWIMQGLSLRINATFIIGAILLLAVFSIQHGGILRSARVTKILGISALLPLLLIGLAPFVSGGVSVDHFFPLVPIAMDASGKAVDGTWNMAGWTLMAGGLFIAAWSTYGFETAVCYTREFRDPQKDTFKAIFYSGLLCLIAFTLVPLAFQGALGLKGMLAPGIYSGMGVGKAMAGMVGGSYLIAKVILVMLILALMLSIMTAMAGSSRTLYQASVDGWLPKYLSRVNEHGAPTRAMWTDLCFNMLLLMMSNYVFILAISNVGYIIFNFLNLNAGWIHRMDRRDWKRPFKAPSWLLVAGFVLSFVNLVLLGMGADIWGSGTLLSGLVFAALIVPIFLFRHYVTDKGKFPKAMVEDMHLGDEGQVVKRAGVLPYVTLLAAVVVVFASHALAVY
jgi:amino acid transporter